MSNPPSEEHQRGKGEKDESPLKRKPHFFKKSVRNYLSIWDK
jgi:hypothetical protein